MADAQRSDGFDITVRICFGHLGTRRTHNSIGDGMAACGDDGDSTLAPELVDSVVGYGRCSVASKRGQEDDGDDEV